jgi:hypothetical protein
MMNEREFSRITDSGNEQLVVIYSFKAGWEFVVLWYLVGELVFGSLFRLVGPGASQVAAALPPQQSHSMVGAQIT